MKMTKRFVSVALRRQRDLMPRFVQVVETYTKAIETVSPRKATANCHRLYINFARFYEEGGTTGSAENDLDSARKIFEKAVKVPFRSVDELAEVWCEWAELELRHECVFIFVSAIIRS